MHLKTILFGRNKLQMKVLGLFMAFIGKPKAPSKTNLL